MDNQLKAFMDPRSRNQRMDCSRRRSFSS